MPKLNQPQYDESSWRMHVGYDMKDPLVEMWVESCITNDNDPKLYVYRHRTMTYQHATKHPI